VWDICSVVQARKSLHARPRERRLASLLLPEFFGALCDPSRLLVLARLLELRRPSTVGEIAACCPTSLSVVSRHLSRLRSAGIIESEKRGREVYYRVRGADVARTLRSMADAMEHCCHWKDSRARRPRRRTARKGDEQ